MPANEGDMDLIPGLGRSPGQGNGNPLQYLQDSCLGDPTEDPGGYSPWGLKIFRHDLAKLNKTDL